MKLWCQSCGSFGTDPVWSEYESSLEKRLSEVRSARTVTDLYGTSTTIPGIDTFKVSQNLCSFQSIQNALIAEQRGYDAFVMISTLDSGIDEIRETLDIPSVFLLENSLHFASMFFKKYAFYTHNKYFLAQLVDQACRYEMAGKMVQGAHLDMSYTDWPELYNSPDLFMDTVLAKGREAAATGAEVLIVGALPLNIWMSQQGIQEIGHCKILDAFGLAVKTAEMLISVTGQDILKPGSSVLNKQIKDKLKQLYLGRDHKV